MSDDDLIERLRTGCYAPITHLPVQSDEARLRRAAADAIEKLRAAIHSAYVEGWTDATSRDDPRAPGVINQEWETSLARQATRTTLKETE